MIYSSYKIQDNNLVKFTETKVEENGNIVTVFDTSIVRQLNNNEILNIENFDNTTIKSILKYIDYDAENDIIFIKPNKYIDDINGNQNYENINLVDLDNYTLPQLKQAKLNELNTLFNNSKLITIQGNYTIEIKHDTPERDIFLTKIEQLSREDIENNTVVGYSQEKNGNLYKIALVPYIWKYIYTNLFLVARASGFKESIRDRNKQLHKEYHLKIQNSATKEAVNDIEFVFINPNGIIINVDDNAQNILNDPTTPSSIIDLINQIPLVNGRLNLITEKIC